MDEEDNNNNNNNKNELNGNLQINYLQDICINRFFEIKACYILLVDICMDFT